MAFDVRIAVFTLTRDRIEYTKHCFYLLNERAGVRFDHYVVDNGSTDGTQDWLRKNIDPFYRLVLNKNYGIAVASNIALGMIKRKQYDLIVKFDNDCEIITNNLFMKMLVVYDDIWSRKLSQMFVFSPRVEGINNQPQRIKKKHYGGYDIGVTGMVGGICRFMPAEIFNDYSFPENLPLAQGCDTHICDWLNKNGSILGYVEDLIVNHYETTDGQAKRYPEYFKRKRREEVETPA